ncbi:MAG: DUF4870 domain-containing protein [Terracidiphilus sp.]|nr:DUF4870 domain-containing protein [Terracidiphilus sp.]MDR3799484.1 DUF4870 domain-containing protein [Terracidiphilus sp.]
MSEDPSGVTQNAGLSENAAAAIAYITFIPALIFLLVDPYKNNPYVRFHAWQSIAFTVSAFVINIALSIVLAIASAFVPFLHFTVMSLVNLFWLIVFIVCLVNAWNGKRFKLPIIGAFAEQEANK